MIKVWVLTVLFNWNGTAVQTYYYKVQQECTVYQNYFANVKEVRKAVCTQSYVPSEGVK